MIKKILLTLFLCLVTCFSGMADLITFRTTTFTYKYYNNGKWGSWTGYQSSDLLGVIDTGGAYVKIFSPTIQLYKIIEAPEEYVDSDGDQVIEIHAIDQDLDKAILKLMKRQGGKIELYVIFRNVIWCYSIVLT